MASILSELDREWAEVATSPSARRALRRWADVHPDLAGHHDLTDVLTSRRDPARAESVLRALALLAPTDHLAARALLQAMLPGLVTLAAKAGSDDPAAIDELLSLGWERIRTYPAQRLGSVAANVLLDVRKRYRRHREIDVPTSVELRDDRIAQQASTEEQVLGCLLVDQLAVAQRLGMMSPAVLATIIRTRLVGERLADIAKEQCVPTQLLCHRRWRAEVRLRGLPLAG